MLKIGSHVSIAGSIDISVDRATSKNCSTFQIFTRSPRRWFTNKLNENDIQKFKTKLDASMIDKFSIVVHMPYLPNLASPNKIIYEKSIDILKQEISRCEQLGIHYLVTHLGSHMNTSETKGVTRLVDALQNVSNTNVMILLENSGWAKKFSRL